MSDLREPCRSTQLLQTESGRATVFQGLELVTSTASFPRQASEVVCSALGKQVRCGVHEDKKDDFMDEGYCTASPTESDIEFFCQPTKSSGKAEVKNVPRQPQIAINGTLLELPQIWVTDESGESENIAPDDDEHGQLWNFTRDKIARRMFFIRADRRTQHMASTFYSDLYPRSTRLARTESATFSAAYVSYIEGYRRRNDSEFVGNTDTTSTLANGESIIYESRTSNHITALTPIASKVLLAVTGSVPLKEIPAQNDESSDNMSEGHSTDPSSRASPPPRHQPSQPSQPNGLLEPPESLLEELSSISEQLSSVLREEMGQMRWPDGA